MYSFMTVIMIFVLIYAFHLATKYHWIELTKYADPNTLAENCRQRQRTYALYPKPEELDLPDADNYTSPKYWDDHTKTRKKQEAERGEAESGSEDDADVALANFVIAGSAEADGAGPSEEAERGNADLSLLDILFPNPIVAVAAKKPRKSSGGARDKSPAPKPMCNKCGIVKLTGLKFKDSGFCAKCTKKSK